MDGTLSKRKRFLVGVPDLTIATHPSWCGWIAEVGTVSYACDGRKQVSQGAYSRRFARAAAPTDKDAANRWVDGVEDKGQPHPGLSNHCTERECGHVPAFIANCILHWIVFGYLFHSHAVPVSLNSGMLHIII